MLNKLTDLPTDPSTMSFPVLKIVFDSQEKHQCYMN
jgi:hypothetical protein